MKTVGKTAVGTQVIKNVYSSTGILKSSIKVFSTSSPKAIVAIDEYKDAYSEDFAAQTSEEIEAELDSHFNPIVAKYLKDLWAVKQLTELAEANNWEITSNILIGASIVDPTGIFGVASAYAKPVCYAVVPFPCTAVYKNEEYC